MKLVSKLIYQARMKGLDIDRSDGVKLKNSVTNKYIHILPNGRICSENILGHDKDLKCLMTEFLIKDPLLFNGSFLCLPCDVSLYVGNETSSEEIIFAKDCLMQCFANVKSFKVVKDDTLLPSECRIEHGINLSYKERQAFINACLEYLK